MLAFLVLGLIVSNIFLAVVVLGLSAGMRTLRGRVDQLEQLTGQVHGDDWIFTLKGQKAPIRIRADTEQKAIQELVRRGVDTKKIISATRDVPGW